MVNASPQPLYPRGRNLVPIVQETGSAPGPVWTGAENIAFTGIRALDREARTGSNEDAPNKFSSPGPRLLAGARYFLFRNRVWGPLRLPLNSYSGRVFSRGLRGRGVKLTTDLTSVSAGVKNVWSCTSILHMP